MFQYLVSIGSIGVLYKKLDITCLCVFKLQICFNFFWFISVQPSVTVGNQLVGCPVGEQVSLKCFVEASPKAISYWTRKSNEREYKDELLLEG